LAFQLKNYVEKDFHPAVNEAVVVWHPARNFGFSAFNSHVFCLRLQFLPLGLIHPSRAIFWERWKFATRLG
jgi:hypothetical protein